MKIAMSAFASAIVAGLASGALSAPNDIVSTAADFKIDRSVMSGKYWEIWNDKVQAKIDADIERYRKADASVEVSAPDGAELKVEQIGHAFRFGAHIFFDIGMRRKETTC